MAVWLVVKRLEFEHPGVQVHGDVISPGLQDAGEFVIRVVDPKELYFFEAGKTYMIDERNRR